MLGYGHNWGGGRGGHQSTPYGRWGRGPTPKSASAHPEDYSFCVWIFTSICLCIVFPVLGRSIYSWMPYPVGFLIRHCQFLFLPRLAQHPEPLPEHAHPCAYTLKQQNLFPEWGAVFPQTGPLSASLWIWAGPGFRARRRNYSQLEKQPRLLGWPRAQGKELKAWGPSGFCFLCFNSNSSCLLNRQARIINMYTV